MYEFWLRINPQLTQYEVTQFHLEILHWGAKSIPTGSSTSGDLKYRSRVRPSTFLNRKTKEGTILVWGYLAVSQLAKPHRNPIKKPANKAEEFQKIKKRFGKDLSPGGKS